MQISYYISRVLRDWSTIQSLDNGGNEFGIYLRLNWRWQAGLCQAHRKSNSGNRSCPPDDSFITRWCWLMPWNFPMHSMGILVIIMQFSRYISQNRPLDNAVSLNVNRCNIHQREIVCAWECWSLVQCCIWVSGNSLFII